MFGVDRRKNNNRSFSSLDGMHGIHDHFAFTLSHFDSLIPAGARYDFGLIAEWRDDAHDIA